MPSAAGADGPADGLVQGGPGRDAQPAERLLDSWLCALPAVEGVGFDRLLSEIPWETVRNWGSDVDRKVCMLGSAVAEGGGCSLLPHFRFLTDHLPPVHSFVEAPAVEQVRLAAEREAGHPLNHCLAQLYTPEDFIQEHADKTLDMAPGTGVVNVSFGATREFLLRWKPQLGSLQTELRRVREGSAVEEVGDAAGAEASKQSWVFKLMDSSIYMLGPRTNMLMTHQITRVKDQEGFKRRFAGFGGGLRISLTFRHIATFQQLPSGRLFGRGARRKQLPGDLDGEGDDAGPPSDGDAAADARRLLEAFARENVATDFDWEAVYGSGYECTNSDLMRAFLAKM